MRLVLATFILMATGLVAAEPFAVVELFTSEGCSSCPPADALFNELARQPRVFALAYHVDYWNSLGWKDPFSKPEFTRRQETYAKTRLYTPQMIVNGTEAFVGSDRSQATRAIAAALKRPATVELKLRWQDDRVAYEVTGAPAGSILHLALIESGLVQKVPRGENAGRTLRHDNVVRDSVSVTLDNAATGSARFQNATAADNHAIIGFVQISSSKQAIAAASIDSRAGNR